jgi:hypothetical protein
MEHTCVLAWPPVMCEIFLRFELKIQQNKRGLILSRGHVVWDAVSREANGRLAASPQTKWPCGSRLHLVGPYTSFVLVHATGRPKLESAGMYITWI